MLIVGSLENFISRIYFRFSYCDCSIFCFKVDDGIKYS